MNTGAAPRTLLLVHGAWHTAAHWDRLVAVLSATGERTAAIDLPSHGAVTLADQTLAVVHAIRREHAYGPVVVVAHSAGGLPVTAAVEEVPELVSHVVYVAAYCPVALPSMAGYLGLPESADAQLGPVFIGDPAVLGAVRIDPRSADPQYQQALRLGFYNDLSPTETRPLLALLTPDLPLRVVTDEVRPTAARWGRVPRSFVRTLADRALPLALQDRMVAEADALTPHNRFAVHSLDSGHSPFASRPEQLAALLRAVT